MRSLLRRKPEVTYSSCVSPGRTSVTVTCRSVTGAVDLSMRFRLAGPTMVVAVVKVGVIEGEAVGSGDRGPVVGWLRGPGVGRGGQVVGRAYGRIGTERRGRRAPLRPGPEGAVGPESEVHGGAGRRPGGEPRCVGGLQRARSQGAATVVEEHPHSGILRGERRPRCWHRGLVDETDGGDRCRCGAARELRVHGGSQRVQGRGRGRHAVGDVEVEEFQPARDRVGAERVGMGSVHHRHVDVLVAAQCSQ